MLLLDDPDAALRARAAKALRRYITWDERVPRKLLEVLDRAGEPDSVRRDALKSLAWAERDSVITRLIATAISPHNSIDIRSLAHKALSLSAHSPAVVDILLATLHDSRADPEVREAAAWGLGGAVDRDAAVSALQETARMSWEPLPLRVEALKSLAGALSYETSRTVVLSVAQDPAEPASLREVAILSLVMIPSDYRARRILEDAARGDPDPLLRQAAIRAMGGLTLELARYFHFFSFLGTPIDILEDQ